MFHVGAIVHKTTKPVFAAIVLAGCSSSPLSYSELSLYADPRDEISQLAAKVPGIVPTTLQNEKEGIVAFGIHGMGRQTICQPSNVAEMFSNNFQEDDEIPIKTGCTVEPVSVMPVCLSQDYTLESEAYHDSFLEVLHIGRECANTDGNFNFEDLTNDARNGEHSDRRLSRFGILMHFKLEGSYRDFRGNPVNIPVDYFAYWWHGDADALQAPFTTADRDSSHKRERAPINQAIKSTVLNDGLVDAALLSGNAGKIMIEGTRGALCLMARILSSENFKHETAVKQPCSHLNIEGLRDALRSKQLVLLSQSLGSRILFDALSPSLSGNRKCKPASVGDFSRTAASIADVINDNAPLLYMSANQLPLLGMSNLQIETDLDCDSAITIASRNQKNTNFFLRLADSAAEANRSSFYRDNAKVGTTIISFYDPNDILGYRAGLHLAQSVRENILEVTQRYAIPWFLFAWPPEAHDKSYDRDKGKQLVLCGAHRSKLDKPKLELNSDCRV